MKRLPIIRSEWVSLQDIRGAVARGWCHPSNSTKVMDGDLAEAISQEIAALITALRSQAVSALEVHPSELMGEIARLQKENAELREALERIKAATLDGTICDDVAWFYGNETLHDYCERMISGDNAVKTPGPGND